MNQITRICNICKCKKPINEFAKDKNKIYGCDYRCKECDKKRFKKYWEKHNVSDMRSERYYSDREASVQKSKEYYYIKKARGYRTKIDPFKQEARLETWRAIKAGLIAKKACEVCGEQKSQAHHSDYNKPLEIMWLCKKHHSKWHRKNKAIIYKNET